MLLKDLMNTLGCNSTRHEALPDTTDADARGSYIANSTVLGLESADNVLLIGTNPRAESPVFNARIRKAVLNGAQVCMLASLHRCAHAWIARLRGLSCVELWQYVSVQYCCH